MDEKRRFRILKTHFRCHIQNREYTKRIKYEDFMDNRLVQDAVIRQIEIIGEAAKRLSKEIREEHPEIPGKIWLG